jgi:hypothetical protein
MSNWRDLAKAAEDARRKAKHGEREAAISRLAPGTDVDVVRRTIPVANFLDELAKRDVRMAETLSSAQFSHLQILARWAALNWDAALQTAEKMTVVSYSVRKLRQEFDIFRRRVGSTEPTNRLTPTPPLLDAIGHLLGGVVSDPLIRPKVLGGRFVDLTLTLHRTGSTRRIGVILVGPYSASRVYTKRMQSVLLSAWAVAWTFDDVVLALPEEAPIQAYRQWLTDAQGEIGSAIRTDQGPHVHLLSMKAGFYGRPTAIKPASNQPLSDRQK